MEKNLYSVSQCTWALFAGGFIGVQSILQRTNIAVTGLHLQSAAHHNAAGGSARSLGPAETPDFAALRWRLGGINPDPAGAFRAWV